MPVPLLLLLFLLLGVNPVWAQDGLTGSVADENGHALPLAHVRLLAADGSELATGFTDARGVFRLNRPACERCRVEASLQGFATASSEAGASPLRIALAIEPIREAVVVSATRGEIPISRVGSAVTVFDSEAIERRGTPLLAELLRASPGVAVVQTGGMGNVASMFVRGGEASYNKVLLDGIPLNEPGGTFDFSNVTTESLDRVELLRGAHSALFGTDAMASVVQLVTRQSSRPNLTASFEAGTYSTSRAAVTAGTRNGAWDVSGHLSRQQTDNRVPNNEFRNTTFSANGGVRASPDVALRFVVRSEAGRVGSPGSTAFGRADMDATYRRRLVVTGVTFEHLRGAWQQRASYGLSASYAESTNLLEDPPYTPTFGLRTAPFEFSDFPYDSVTDLTRHHASYQIDRRIPAAGLEHMLTGVVDWDGERAELTDRLADTVVPASRDNAGGAVQYQLLGRRFALTTGLRIERNDSFGTAVVPRASFAYVVREASDSLGSTRLKASAGAGVKEPTVLQSFSPNPFFLGNPDLDPERARTVDAGIEHRLFGGRAKVELTGFHGRFENIISTRTISFNPFQSQYFNVGLSHARGTELSAGVAPTADWNIRGGHTFLSSEVTRSTSPASEVFAEGQWLFRRPRHSGFLQATWTHRPVSIGVYGVFVGRRVDSDFASLEPPLTANDGYVVWAVNGSYRVMRRLTALVRVDNVGNASYMEPLGYPAWRRSARVGAKVDF